MAHSTTATEPLPSSADGTWEENPAQALLLSYLVPVRGDHVDEELVTYVAGLVPVVEDVIVVDGSDEDVYDSHSRRLPSSVRHLRPERVTPMGKVGGVLTGLAYARHDLVVIADDDVRWDRHMLERAVAKLGGVQVGRPQHVFDPSPWHARWDTGRMLLNRAGSGDWPGTMLVRRSALPHGYAGDALFENLEMVRTVRAAGGSERVLFDVVVPRRPPSSGRFWEQRVRQAYDEWARPWRLVFQLTWLPLVVFRPRRAIGLAARGPPSRRSDGVAPAAEPTGAATDPLWAVPWMIERSVTSWLAVFARLRGGVTYRGTRLPVAAHSMHWLRQRSRAA